MNEISKLQKVNFSVFKKNGIKFFAVFVKRIMDPCEQFYENVVYFESLSVDVLPLDGKVEIYKGDKLIDECIIKLRGPGGRDGVSPEFTFNKFKKAGDKRYLNAKNFKVGDLIIIDWQLSDIELHEINRFLKNQDLAGAIKMEEVPMYVEEYFVSRVGFHQELKPFIFPFTIYCSVLGGFHG